MIHAAEDINFHIGLHLKTLQHQTPCRSLYHDSNINIYQSRSIIFMNFNAMHCFPSCSGGFPPSLVRKSECSVLARFSPAYLINPADDHITLFEPWARTIPCVTSGAAFPHLSGRQSVPIYR